ncbi:ERCC4 domain-containing protein [Ferrimicrobium sp.]|uniref:ERCC4 domain-containing protein n=1 Tax=Ferrimicrobium sp. TaxID=2926050 RepID=UPI002611A9F4|nr:ERCC4 domain-containing protein [Ferrimicrobium sp.]
MSTDLPYLTIARNPDAASGLGYLVMIPIDGGMVVKTSGTWPRTKALYCHPVPISDWPTEPEVVEEITLLSCARRGAAIDIVADRARENRSQLVFTHARGRDMIFWQSTRTQRQAKPKGTVPRARAHGVVDIPITIDTRERYPYQFRNRSVNTQRGALPCGDYGVYLGTDLYAAVERKTLEDLIASLSDNRLRYAIGQLAALAHAAIVVEARYSAILQSPYMRPALILDAVADYALRWPEVPVVFCENRKLAEEWTYRYLAAAYHQALSVPTLMGDAQQSPSASPTSIREWASEHNIAVPAKGRIPRAVREQYLRAHGRSIPS